MLKREQLTLFAATDRLSEASVIHLVGIGGAGMSAIARMFFSRGLRVQGSDAVEGEEVVRLRSEGISVEVGHRSPTYEQGTALVVTDAVDLDTNPEVLAAISAGVPMFRRSQALGWLLRGHRLVAVTGTHGKTTTTGLTGAAFIGGHLDPLVVVGASVPEWGGPVRYGEGQWAVAEACEAYDGYQDLDPEVVILTNLELDHVDYHRTWKELQASMRSFVAKIPPHGCLIFCAEDAGASEIADGFAGTKIPYRTEDAPSGMLLPGKHNRQNLAGALAAAKWVGADVLDAQASAMQFEGAERRLQILRDGPIKVLDDYAHHPTAILASLKAVRQCFPAHRLIVVYQPHLYSRTAELIPEFAAALSHADFAVVTDIYPAREEPIPGVSSVRIVEQMTIPTRYVPSRFLLPRQVAALLRPGDVVVGMGAGSISEFAPNLIREIDREITLCAGERRLRVCVALGGDSSEREVSLLSGNMVAKALSERGYKVSTLDFTDLLLGNKSLSGLVGEHRPDVVFLAVHGTNAEDGAIQGLCELLHLPYTGSGLLASAIAMDKAATKQILSQHGISVPAGVILSSPHAPLEMQAPCIVKPNQQGSTVGLTFVESNEELPGALERAFAYPGDVLVEEWVLGMEISTPVLCGEALLPLEIAVQEGRYDFAGKYTVGATLEICPARLPEAVLEQAREIALKCHRILGCHGATRTDAIVRMPQGAATPIDEMEVVVLEVNTLPGMTGTSLLPKSAEACGISFSELCDRMVQDALSRASQRVRHGT